MRLKTLVFPIILLALAACGEGDEIKLEKGPFLLNDRNELLFDTEFGSGTYVDASTFNTLILENRGDEPLEITSITMTAPTVFKMRVAPELAQGSLTLESRKSTFVEVQFSPKEARTYEGKVTITSNALNAPAKDIRLFAKGVPKP